MAPEAVVDFHHGYRHEQSSEEFIYFAFKDLKNPKNIEDTALT
jgi:hypothetical protein